MLNNIGIIGLGVMGKAIAQNIGDHGYTVSLYNKTYEKTALFVKQHTSFSGFEKLNDFVNSLEKPRKILLMVSANAVDYVLDQLLELVEKEDIIMDGGNSFYRDSERRMKQCAQKGIYFIGMGISGGEEGALHGPSLMPSSDHAAYVQVASLLENIAAKNDEGDACVSYIGQGGSGHFVKMVHNGIEYADMQLISETYMALKKNNYNNAQIADIFETWNQGELFSYLITITIDILRFSDEEGEVLDRIKDVAHHKGTGAWSALSAIEYNEAVPSLIAALQARFISSKKKVNHAYDNDEQVDDSFIDDLKMSFYLSKVMIYHQGFELMKKVSDENNWGLDFTEIARIWQKGCIIQSAFLKKIISVYREGKTLLEDEKILQMIDHDQRNWRHAMQILIMKGVYAPVYLSSLTYYEGLSTCLGMNLIQAQRDYFGAHTYERIDKSGFYHTEWQRN